MRSCRSRARPAAPRVGVDCVRAGRSRAGVLRHANRLPTWQATIPQTRPWSRHVGLAARPIGVPGASPPAPAPRRTRRARASPGWRRARRRRAAASGDRAAALAVTGVVVHHVGLRGLGAERERGTRSVRGRPRGSASPSAATDAGQHEGDERWPARGRCWRRCSHELAHVAYTARPLRCGDDAAEVVVDQHHVRGLARDVGASPPIATPMSARGAPGVVDAVASDCHHLVASLAGLDQRTVLGETRAKSTSALSKT